MRESRELNRFSNRSSANTSLWLLKSMDDAIESEKRLIKRINIKMIAFNTGMITLMFAYLLYQLWFYQKTHNNWHLYNEIQNITYMTILLLNSFFLGYAVFQMRRTIKALSSTFPNEKFIRIHLANVLIYTILYLFIGAFFVAIQREREELTYLKIFFSMEALYIFIDVFGFYMDLFLIYLILRFTKPHIKETGQDLVLGK